MADSDFVLCFSHLFQLYQIFFSILEQLLEKQNISDGWAMAEDGDT